MIISSASLCLSCQRCICALQTDAHTPAVKPGIQLKLPVVFGVLLCHSAISCYLQEFQEQMKGASFKDVVIRGKELSGALITGLINVYIKDNASVDAISNHLRDICPLLYSSDDSVCSKVRTHTFFLSIVTIIAASGVSHSYFIDVCVLFSHFL